MRRLTLKSRFALFFSLFVFFLLILLYSLFFLTFNLLSAYQVRNDLIQETNEVIISHLISDRNKLFFKRDESGASLREHLINENFSAVFFSKDRSVLRAYGTFAYGNKKELTNNFNKQIDEIISGKKTLEKDITWNKLQLKAYIVPLKSQGKLLEIMVLGKSLEDFRNTKQLIFNIFLVSGFFLLFGSFLTGYYLSHHAFNPILKIIRTVENLNIDRLDTSIEIKGHPSDELVILSKKFNEMTSRLKEMVDRQRQFIANASHELKTPLTRAITRIEMIELNPDQEKKELTLVKQDLFSFSKLIDNLLSLTKLKERELIPNKIYRINLPNLFNKLKTDFKKKLKEKQLNLTGTFPNFTDINLPQEYLEIVITNLISNSIKYSAFNKEVTLNVTQLSKDAVIRIKDEGIGMTQSETKHIFNRFYRNRNHNDEKGYGIGLSIVKKICDIYGVDIKVKSEKGRGTLISLHFKSR